MSDRTKVIAVLNGLAELHGVELSAKRQALFAATLLERYTAEEIRAAGSELRFTLGRMPTPAHFVEAIDGAPLSPQDQRDGEASDAWASVVRQDGNSSEITDRICEKLFGSYYEAGRMASKALGFYRRDFLAAYMRAVKAERADGRAQVIAEIEGTGRGVKLLEGEP